MIDAGWREAEAYGDYEEMAEEECPGCFNPKCGVVEKPPSGLTDELLEVLPGWAIMYYDEDGNDGFSAKQHLVCELGRALLARQRDSLALRAIVEQLEKCNYECEAGPLRLNTAFIELKEMADVDR